MPIAAGLFDVTLTPEAVSATAQPAALGRFSIDKRFHGDLEASSKGEMLSVGTATKGSAGYVALEKVDGSVHGRSGSFLLQHSGSMRRGVGTLSVTVVPDSGTGALVGLTGTMVISVADGVHSYRFDYCIMDSN